jgi:hypothetical protein
MAHYWFPLCAFALPGKRGISNYDENETEQFEVGRRVAA